MGESFEIRGIDAVNGGTLIQVDFKGETTAGRMFLPTCDVLAALNNSLAEAHERDLIEHMGMVKTDPNELPGGTLITFEKMKKLLNRTVEEAGV